jgi:hypothetical protein
VPATRNASTGKHRSSYLSGLDIGYGDFALDDAANNVTDLSEGTVRASQCVSLSLSGEPDEFYLFEIDKGEEVDALSLAVVVKIVMAAWNHLYEEHIGLAGSGPIAQNTTSAIDARFLPQPSCN